MRPALKTDAQPARYLDFMIHEAVKAVMLHRSGVFVYVPAPERFAVHELILALERPPGAAKRNKDVAQAGALIVALAEKRPEELRLAWEEARATWRKLLLGGMQLLSAEALDLLLRVLEQPRKIVPGMDRVFPDTRARCDSTIRSPEATGRLSA